MTHLNSSEYFSGKVCIVTGAASGIGRATALAFSRRGAKIAVVDYSRACEETAAEIKRLGGDALCYKCDVSQSYEVSEMVQAVKATFGRLDFAFNNAGVEGSEVSTVECTEESWDKTIDTNLKGIWLCMKYEIPLMLENPGAAIVNCASVLGLVGMEKMPAYTASKHGVVGLTKVAALDYAHSNLRINAVCPGAIRTPMLDRVANTPEAMNQLIQANEPIGRIGEPAEIAEAVLWLCSPQSSFVTGQAIAVDGGWTVR